MTVWKFVVLNGGFVMRNFKRILSIALTLFVIICITACDEKVVEETSVKTETVTEPEKIISMDKRHKVIECLKDEQKAYVYYLYDSYGNVIYEQTVLREPRIKYVSEDVIEISNSAGTSALSCSYFNLTTNKISESCWNPSYVDGKIVVYMEYDETREPSAFLVIKDIFDNNKLFMELFYDFSPMAVPADAIKSVEAVGDNTLKIVYLKGEKETETTVVVDLK